MNMDFFSKQIPYSSVDSGEIYDHLQEALAVISIENDTKCIWVSNKIVTGTSFDCDEMFWTDYSPNDILDELSFFEEIFVQQINYLKTKYETVEIKWGIFNTANDSRSKTKINTALANNLRKI